MWFTVNLTVVILMLVKYGMIFCLFIGSWPSDRNLVQTTLFTLVHTCINKHWKELKKEKYNY